MKNKKLYYIILLLFLVITIFFIGKDFKKNKEVVERNSFVQSYSSVEIKKESSDIKEGEINAEKNEYVVYYFHNNVRCSTCHKIENYTRDVFEKNFKDKYIFKIINIDDDENKHFINDYALYTKSVVLVKNKDDKEVSFINLPKVWDNIRNEDNFKNYLKTQMDSFLNNRITINNN